MDFRAIGGVEHVARGVLGVEVEQWRDKSAHDIDRERSLVYMLVDGLLLVAIELVSGLDAGVSVQVEYRAKREAPSFFIIMITHRKGEAEDLDARELRVRPIGQGLGRDRAVVGLDKLLAVADAIVAPVYADANGHLAAAMPQRSVEVGDEPPQFPRLKGLERHRRGA